MSVLSQPGRLLRAGLPGLLLLAAGPALAGTATRPAEKTGTHAVTARQGELKDVRHRIDRLGKELTQTEQTRARTRERLNQTESAISATNQTLNALAEKRRATEAALARLQQQIRRIETQQTTQQRQLGQLLYQQYLRGDESTDALRSLLSGNDIQQTSRDRYYQTQLSRAKADLLGQLRKTLAEKQQLGESAQTRQEELAGIEQQQQQQRSLLLEQQQQRQAALLGLGDRIKAQQREIDALKRDERRLGGIIDQLVQAAAREARARAARKKARQAAEAGSVIKPAPRKSSSPPISLPAGPATPAPPPQRNDHEPEPESEDRGYSGNFSALKGQLRLPVRGELIHRFGSPRAEGGSIWKGLFIRAAEGSEIKAPAPGRVVFADWLRGFGNLLIIDHGDAWLSVYGNNQALLRHAGDIVRTGDAIATAGSSGSTPESGLYFELRQQGRAIDPLGWVKLK